MKKIFLSAIFGLSVFLGFADEGMWMLHLLKQQKLSEMRKLGLQLEDYDIYDPDGTSLKDAVVLFGKGCTGEVISSQGLVLTNHHCGYSRIQHHSTLENNYLDEGFWAMTKAAELPNPGLTVTFIDRMEDVTDYVKECLARDKEEDSEGIFFLSPSYLNRIAREKVGGEFLSAPGIEVEIKPFFDGNQYYMFTKKTYSDVRLVGAPPSAIGKFGADTDNWMWPRHTGDFSLFRIYADRDGNPAGYSPDNVPLKPKRWLKIAAEGVNEGDFAMILGFPGTTHQYYTSWEVAERRDIDNSVRIDMREVRQNALLEEMLADPAVKIQYAAKYSGSTNAYKNAVGTNWAIGMRDFEQLKFAQQERLLEWAENNRRPAVVEALSEIRRMVDERGALRFRSRMLNEGIVRGVEFANVPQKGWSLLLQAIGDAESGEIDSIFSAGEGMDKALLQLKRDYDLFANKDYNAAVDKKVSAAMIAAYTGLVDKEQQPAFFALLHTRFNGDAQSFIDFIFDHSLFGNRERWHSFNADPRAFISHEQKREQLRNDPMFLFARSVREEALSLEEQLSRYDIPFSLARRTYLEGILAMDGPYTRFPDANLTLRLTYGQVKGYQPRDAVTYAHQTTLKGVMEKEDPGNWEFVVPEKLKTLYQRNDFGRYALSDGSMPVNFAATTHTTGGNSGSPVLNGKGELIGINFDRNWEGVGGDIHYLPDYQRSIIVDIRYLLFIIDKFAGAGHLIEELELE